MLSHNKYLISFVLILIISSFVFADSLRIDNIIYQQRENADDFEIRADITIFSSQAIRATGSMNMSFMLYIDNNPSVIHGKGNVFPDAKGDNEYGFQVSFYDSGSPLLRPDNQKHNIRIRFQHLNHDLSDTRSDIMFRSGPEDTSVSQDTVPRQDTDRESHVSEKIKSFDFSNIDLNIIIIIAIAICLFILTIIFLKSRNKHKAEKEEDPSEGQKIIIRFDDEDDQTDDPGIKPQEIVQKKNKTIVDPRLNKPHSNIDKPISVKTCPKCKKVYQDKLPSCPFCIKSQKQPSNNVPITPNKPGKLVQNRPLRTIIETGSSNININIPEINAVYSLNDFNKTALRIGRNQDNDIPITHNDSVSGYHCMLIRRNNDWFLQDNNSSNGTIYNGEKISSSLKLIKGQVFLLGEVKIIIN